MLDIVNISEAIDNNKEVVVQVINDNGFNQYFRISDYPISKQYFDYYGEFYWVPTFINIREDGESCYAKANGMFRDRTRTI